MSMSNPNAYANSLPARVARLEQALFSSSGAQLGKLKAVSNGSSQQGFSWTGPTTGLGSPVRQSTTLAVPAFATTVSMLAIAHAAVTSNASANAAAYSQLWTSIAELSLEQDHGPNIFVQSNQQMQRLRPLALASVTLPTGVTTLTVTANGYVLNTGINADNFLGIDVLALFQY